MRKSKYNSFDELPLMLTVEDVSHVLGIGLAHAYEVGVVPCKCSRKIPKNLLN